MSYNYSHTNRQQLIGQGEKPGRRKFCVDSEGLLLFCIGHFLPKESTQSAWERLNSFETINDFGVESILIRCDLGGRLTYLTDVR